MKRMNCFRYIVACMLFVCITACDKDKPTIEDEIPAAIKSDFQKRYPASQISDALPYPDDQYLIDFTDRERNEASAWYVNDSWEMTYTEIYNMQQLPVEVQNTFNNLGYGDAQNIEIFKSERAKADKDLYMFHFQYTKKKIENLEHYVFISSDGLFLTLLNWPPNDMRMMARLPQDHLDFIARKYTGAEIRGYLNNGGQHEYFILHQDTVKFVFFGGVVAADKGFWEETRYELSKDTPIPDNVIKVLKQDDPDFVYTNIYYIESEEGNAYFLQDKNRDDELGHTIRESLQPREK